MSTLAGAVMAAILQAWRERVVHRRSLRTRWDQMLLTGLVDYLATADRALRAMLRCRYERSAGQVEAGQAVREALEAFESLHEKSQVISVLAGDRDHPVRLAARLVREPMLPLREDLLAEPTLSSDEVRQLVTQHREGRNQLIRAAQTYLGVTDRLR
ncbi:hypothetical protein [Cryptosporangium sp. NPDC051539]|uniref:hypothetical protein n=1 Tax=Cryptosporangium sp. NPDC051539 TaxID=3363962 RepID=UPI00379D449E